ncbi:MAG: TatD family hydrolase [Clostridia bacterium]|nr:TatD family hydrolase [Clostridia bacterium]
MDIFDTHAHYDDEKFDKDRDEVIRSLKDGNVTKCINIGCDIDTSKKACNIANTYEFIYAAIRNSSK